MKLIEILFLYEMCKIALASITYDIADKVVFCVLRMNNIDLCNLMRWRENYEKAFHPISDDLHISKQLIIFDDLVTSVNVRNGKQIRLCTFIPS